MHFIGSKVCKRSAFDEMKHNLTHNNAGNIRVAFFLNPGFTLLEIIGGLWTNSLAILSDALLEIKSKTEEMNFEHLTIEFEYGGEDCTMECLPVTIVGGILALWIGGLLTTIASTLLLLPALYGWFEEKK